MNLHFVSVEYFTYCQIWLWRKRRPKCTTESEKLALFTDGLATIDKRGKFPCSAYRLMRLRAKLS